MDSKGRQSLPVMVMLHSTDGGDGTNSAGDTAGGDSMMESE